MMRGWRSSSFTFVRSSVTPAMALNSPPDKVVGTLICRTVGGFIGGGPTVPSAPFTGRSLSIAPGERISLARHICTALAPSVMEPPPMVTIRSACAALAASVASMTARRGVCGGIRLNVPAHRLPSPRRTLSISSVFRLSELLTIRKTRVAPRRCTWSATASAAALPNTTSSISPKTTRPACNIYSSHGFAVSRPLPPLCQVQSVWARCCIAWPKSY